MHGSNLRDQIPLRERGIYIDKYRTGRCLKILWRGMLASFCNLLNTEGISGYDFDYIAHS